MLENHRFEIWRRMLSLIIKGSLWLIKRYWGIIFIIVAAIKSKAYYFEIELLFGVLLTCLIALISRRKYGSILLGSLIVLLITEVSILKQDYLGHRLHISDIAFLWQAPELMGSFINLKIKMLICCFILVAVVSLKYEKKPLAKPKTLLFVIVACVLAISVGLKRYKNPICWSIGKKDANIALLLTEYFHDHRLDTDNLEQNSNCVGLVTDNQLNLQYTGTDKKPHIIGILLESQTDLNLLKGFAQWGTSWKEFKAHPITVYTKGGMTYIQEYAFLHGENPQIYGKFFYKINALGPRFKLNGRLAPYLKKQGYNTYSYLAYKRKMYYSELFHRSLGIDKIVDCKDRSDCSLPSYDIDKNMMRWMISHLKQSDTPQFMFGLTISNHGHYKQSNATNDKPCPIAISKSLCQELNEYDRRSLKIKNMIADFIDQVNALDRRVIIAFFGDHISVTLHDNFKSEQFVDGRDNEAIFMLYDSGSKKFIDVYEQFKLCKTSIPSEHIDALLLAQANFTSHYVDKKLRCMRDCGN